MAFTTKPIGGGIGFHRFPSDSGRGTGDGLGVATEGSSQLSLEGVVS